MKSCGPLTFPSTHTLTLTLTRAFPKGSRSLPEAFARTGTSKWVVMC